MRIAKRSFEIAHQPRLAHATHANEQGSIATGPVSTTARDGRELLEHTKPKPFEKPTNRTVQRKRHDHPQFPVRTHRQHPARQTQPRDRRHQSHHRGEGRIPEPGRLVQGPHRRTHHRRGRTQRRTEARRRDRGTDLRQHRCRTRARGFAARIPCDLHPAGQGVRSQACGIARLWRRSGRDSHRRRSGRPALLLPGGGPSRQGDSRRLPSQPVRQSERSRKPLSHHWSGNLGGHRPQGHAFRGGRRHRRHHLRHRTLSEGRVQRRGAGHRRRSGRLHLLRPERRAPIPDRRRRRGLLSEGL